MRRVFAVLLALSLTAAACGDDADTDEVGASDRAPSSDPSDDADEPAGGDGDDTTADSSTTSSTTTTSTTTTAPPPEFSGEDYAEIGPYPVGVTTRELSTGNRVEVWYPAGIDAEGQTETYAVRNFTPELMRPFVPEEMNDRFEVPAGRDASVAPEGPFPMVMFSHGANSFRLQSTALTHHLASWGMVVVSTDHPTRDLIGLLGRPDGLPLAADDVAAARALITTDPTLGPIIDGERVAVSGHSAGGGTSLAVAAAGDILGYISYASGASEQFETDGLPDVPSVFMAGAIDTIISPERTRAAFDLAPSPSWYLEFADSGHLAFSDLCSVGDGDATLIDLADAAGLSDFLDDGLRRLGTDGCEPPNRPTPEVWPGIHQASVGFYRWLFGDDLEPQGLDASAISGVVTDEK